MTNEFVICLGRREKVLEALKKYGFNTIVVVDKSLSLPKKSLCDYLFHVENISEYDEVISVLEPLLNLNITSVISLSEKAMLTSSLIRKKFNISGHTEEDVMKFTDKYLMKEYAKNHDVKIADFQVVVSYEEGVNFITKLCKENKAVVAKPRDGLGTVGVVKISSGDTSSWEEYYTYYLNNIDKHYFTNGILLEEFIDGEEYHIDTLVQDHKVIFAQPSKYLKNNLDFQKHLLVGSVLLNKEHSSYKKLVDFNEEVVSKFNVDYGSTHMECFICDDGSVVLNEIALRPAGNSIPEMLNDAFKEFNFYESFVLIECFKTVTINQQTSEFKYYGYAHIPVSTPGTIEKLVDREVIMEVDGIYGVDYNVTIGDEVSSINYSNEKIGVVYAHSDSFSELNKNLVKAINIGSKYHTK